MSKDISSNMTFKSKSLDYCCSCGRNENINHYQWVSLVTKDLLGVICEKCAVKEVWGNKFRTNKGYQEWQRENK